jgi:hypothetical protein
MGTAQRIEPGLLAGWSGDRDRFDDSGRPVLRRVIETVLILSLILGFFAVDWESVIFQDAARTSVVHAGPSLALQQSAR